jgi:phospholipid/cholesterol/gamma-HCH transport system ATP-binding protein
MNNLPAKIAVANLCKSFGKKQVLKDASLNVTKGESLVIIGGSGSGKSVLLKCILGLITPESGSITIDGVDALTRNSREREALMRKFGMLFQGGALFDSLTVWENITFAVRQREKLSKAHAIERATVRLKQVGLASDVALLKPSELSGGMQKRVALARAICGNPEILFFDEPTTGLDPIMAEVINELIVACVKEIGATAVTITHDMHSARSIADRIAMIYQGAIIWEGAAASVMESGNAYVDQFVHGRASGPIASAA